MKVPPIQSIHAAYILSKPRESTPRNSQHSPQYHEGHRKNREERENQYGREAAHCLRAGKDHRTGTKKIEDLSAAKEKEILEVKPRNTAPIDDLHWNFLRYFTKRC